MKKVILCVFLLFTLICYSQKKNQSQEKVNLQSSIHSLSFSANNAEELKNINWEDVKKVFKTNKDDEDIKLSFNIDLKESKNKIKGSIEIKGKNKNIDVLIKRVKKGVKGLIKVINNNKA